MSFLNLALIYQCIKHTRIRIFSYPYFPDIRLYPYTREHGSLKTRILAYFVQCVFLLKLDLVTYFKLLV